VQVTDFEHFYDFGFARPVDDIFGQPLNQFGLADILSFIKKYYLSCIASVGFGLNIDCFSDKPSEFEKQALYTFKVIDSKYVC